MSDEFHSIEEICQKLSIPRHTWNEYIKTGIISKQKPTKYSAWVVAQELIRNQRSNVRNANNTNMQLNRKIKRLEQKLQEAEHGKVDENGIITKPMTEKEKVDLSLQKQKLRKIKHENIVREKGVMPVDNVFEFVTSIAAEFAASLDPMVGKVKQMFPDMNARKHDELTKMFARTRNDLARHVEGETTQELINLFNPDNGADDDDY